jgi:small subunit ribosomal protein S1
MTAVAANAPDSVDDQVTRVRQGQVYEAVVDKVHPDAVLIHLVESKRNGFAPASDLRELDDDVRCSLAEGAHQLVRILKDPGPSGELVVSFRKGSAVPSRPDAQPQSRDEDWRRAEDLLNSGETFEARVTGSNSGGLVVAFGGLEGFVPNSHLERAGASGSATQASLVGRTLSLRMLEVDRTGGRLVLSQRAGGEEAKEQILAQLEKGQVRTGIVRNIVDFGAFVDLGGIDGLIHISKLEWRHVDHPSEVLQVGDEVEVFVLDVDRERQRISLSRKRLLPRPADPAHTSPDDSEPARVTGRYLAG